MVDSYSVSYGEELSEIDIPENAIAAIARVPAFRVNDYFAVREVFGAHPAGEDLYIRGAQLDHIPTGRRVYGGVDDFGFGVSPGRACEAFAASIATLPVDWSSESLEAIEAALEPYAAFLKRARRAADLENAISWTNSPENQGSTEDSNG